MKDNARTTLTCEQAEELLLQLVAQPREQLIEHLAGCHDCLTNMAAMGAVMTGRIPSAAAEALRLAECRRYRDDLPLYLEFGEADARKTFPEVATHLNRCPDCRERLRFLRSFDSEAEGTITETAASATPSTKAPAETLPVSTAAPRRSRIRAWRRQPRFAWAAAATLVVTIGLISWNEVEAAQRATAVAREQRLELAELTNAAIQAAQENDRRAFENTVEAFELGETPSISRRATIQVRGTVRYPRSCKHYWILFSEHRATEGITVSWPVLAVRNRGLVSQEIDHRITVPPDMDGGEVLLACVDEATHEEFRAWTREGNAMPLLARDLEVVLKTTLTIE